MKGNSFVLISVLNLAGKKAAMQLCYPDLIEGTNCPHEYLQDLPDIGETILMCSICRSDFCNKFDRNWNTSIGTR